MGNPNIYTPLLGYIHEIVANTAYIIIYRELLAQTSQQLSTDLADRKKHYDSLSGLLQVIPAELQLLQNNISEVLCFVPTIKNAVLQIQHHNNSQFNYPIPPDGSNYKR